MKRLLALGLAALVTVSSALAAGWEDDYTKAFEAAKTANKPVLLDFTGSDWCGWCIKLKKEVFDTREFKDWAKDKVVLAEVDFPQGKPQSDRIKKQNDELQKKYGIEGYPTIILTDKDGNVLGKLGYMPGGPKAWTAKADEILAAAKKK